MKNALYLFSFFLIINEGRAQQMYFPPLLGSQWDTLSPVSLGWCEDYLDSLDQYLLETDSKAFILLKDGKIVHEKYLGNFTKDSLWYWASAGKSLTSTLIGIAQQEGLLSISNVSSTFLGPGWTNAPIDKENLITIKNQLCMTTGLDDNVPNSDCTADSCLLYEADAGTRWAYHNAPYTLLDVVLQSATGLSMNSFLQTRVKVKTGMTGLYIQTGDNNVFFSTARSMARFGLLALNRGIWNGDSVLKDQNYFSEMVNTSQDLNKSYGYLWWLNGKPSYRLPETQFEFTGSIIPNGPSDLFCALGKNDQKIHVVPSKGLVWIRMGNSATPNQLVPVVFDNQIWAYLNGLICNANSSLQQIEKNTSPLIQIEGNSLKIENSQHELMNLISTDVFGRVLLRKTIIGSTTIDLMDWAEGLHIISLESKNKVQTIRWIKQ